jgi:hypothetical protein
MMLTMAAGEGRHVRRDRPQALRLLLMRAAVSPVLNRPARVSAKGSAAAAAATA